MIRKSYYDHITQESKQKNDATNCKLLCIFNKTIVFATFYCIHGSLRLLMIMFTKTAQLAILSQEVTHEATV